MTRLIPTLCVASALMSLACKRDMTPDRPVPASDPMPAWDATLAAIVTPDGYVDYDRLDAHREELDDAVRWLTQVTPPATPTASLAFWLNTYNLLTLYTMADAGRPTSIKAIPTRGLWFGPPGAAAWQQQTFRVGHDRLSLGEIEHERLRATSQDLRLHAAINCASMSCPPLRPELYQPFRLEQQLNDQMWWWINDADRGATVTNGVAVLSPIFSMFEGDFLQWSAQDSLCHLVGRYAEPALRAALFALDDQGCPHTSPAYDWSVNDVTRPERVTHRDLRATHPVAPR